MHVRVAIQIPSSKTFTYAVPEALCAEIVLGKRVLVPFGKRRVTGFIVETDPPEACTQPLREIISLADPEPLFDRTDLDFYEWISRYYLHPLGKVLRELLPGGIDVKSQRWVRLVAALPAERGKLPVTQLAIVDCLAGYPKGVLLSRLRRAIGREDLQADLRSLEAAGIVTGEERLNRPAVRPKKEAWAAPVAEYHGVKGLTARQAAIVEALRISGETPVRVLRDTLKTTPALLRNLSQRGMIRLYEREISRGPGSCSQIGTYENGLTLNRAQAAALDDIRRGLQAGRFSPCLLHGVTGSGKTEVYLRAIREVLQSDDGAIYLVPEIALTAQLISRVRACFPSQEIAILHSGIAPSARYDQWRRIRRGEVRMVVGARSALFAPVQNLRLIVVDEEHDTSYKQDDRLRYNARDLALVKGQLLQATVILGSATPSIQSYFHAAEGRYQYLALPDRIDDHPLPRVEVVDMRTQRTEQGLTPLLSSPLITAVGETLSQGRQTLLFLNRRGFHTFLFCPECGHTFCCPNCDIALTLHATEALLKCHHCDFTARSASSCPKCRGSHIRSYGAGTERVEEEIRSAFPQARIARMDSDTASRKGDTERILQDLGSGQIDVLIGTQMITKGHDFPGITLVGVIAADGSLNIPDFRAAERTFQILTQVSGRSGRGDQPGRVVIQTFNPAHYTIQRAKEHDYTGFYGDELPLRRQLGYPPFSRLIGIHLSSLKRDEGKRATQMIGQRARDLARNIAGGGVDVIGPAESPLARVRGRYRWQLLLRGQEGRSLRPIVQKLLGDAAAQGLQIQVDVDPVNFM